jgi:hypothetical protein
MPARFRSFVFKQIGTKIGAWALAFPSLEGFSGRDSVVELVDGCFSLCHLLQE